MPPGSWGIPAALLLVDAPLKAEPYSSLPILKILVPQSGQTP